MVNWHKFFTSILDTISDGVFISDAMGTTLYVNQMYADLVGVPARDLRGKNVRDLVSEGFFDLALNPEVVRTGKPATYMQKLKDGKNVVISGSPVFDDKGRVCLVVTFVRDETRLAELNEQTGEQRKLIKEINDKLAFVAQSQGRDLEPVFSSSAMQSVAMELKRYASTDATVLIMGETGVGKDVFARLTHRWSRRKDKILLKVDCGGISETLTESEIFGYVPGAFTGASSKGKPGYFEIADGSTIFLDEVGELPLSMQTRLLRVLQDNEIVRVGSSQPRKVDVRIIAATNRNLEECVEAGTFRRDLFYRLNVGHGPLPPLRERPEDVRVLAELFLRQYTTKYRKKLAFMDITLDMLAQYRWPGNVRELQNLVHSLVITRQGPRISPRDLPSNISGLHDESGGHLDAVLMQARPPARDHRRHGAGLFAPGHRGARFRPPGLGAVPGQPQHHLPQAAGQQGTRQGRGCRFGFLMPSSSRLDRSHDAKKALPRGGSTFFVGIAESPARPGQRPFACCAGAAPAWSPP